MCDALGRRADQRDGHDRRDRSISWYIAVEEVRTLAARRQLGWLPTVFPTDNNSLRLILNDVARGIRVSDIDMTTRDKKVIKPPQLGDS